jgi:hypothetical protein
MTGVNIWCKINTKLQADSACHQNVNFTANLILNLNVKSQSVSKHPHSLVYNSPHQTLYSAECTV